MKIGLLLSLFFPILVSANTGDTISAISTKHNANHYMPVFSDGRVQFVDPSGITLNASPIKTDYNICKVVTNSDCRLKSILTETCYRYHDGMVLVKKPGNFFWNIIDDYGCYDSEGKELFTISSNLVGYFSDGLLPVLTTKQFLFFLYDYKFGYVNNKGKMIIPPIYDYAVPFTEGLAHVLFEGKYGYFDKEVR